MAKKRSLKTQILLLIIPTALVLILFINFNQKLMNDMTSRGLISLERNNLLNTHLKQIKNNLHIVESLIYQYTVTTTSELQANLSSQLLILLQSVNDLVIAFNEQEVHLENSDIYLDIVDRLLIQTSELEDEVEKYHELLWSPYKRYPGLKLINEKLLPTNERFLQLVDLAIDEVNISADSEHHATYLKIFNEIRYAWSQQITWVRMFIANRAGVFGNTEESMQANLVNRDIYLNQVEELLSQLKLENKNAALEVQGILSLDAIIETYEDYQKDFEIAKATYISGHWRADYQFLHQKLNAKLSEISETLQTIDEEVSSNNSDTLTESYSISDNINTYVFMFSIGMILLILAALFIFDRLINKPIQIVAAALDAEASGEQEVSLPDSKLKETDLLVNAFKNMREKVNSRQVRLKAILNNAMEGIITIDENGIIETFNVAAERLFGYSADEVIGQNVSMLAPEPYRSEHDRYIEKHNKNTSHNYIGNEREVIAQRKDGTTFPMSIKLSELHLSGKKYFTALLDDVSERKAMIDDLRQLAEHDSLTGLYNRFYFTQELQRVVERVQRNNENQGALLYIDLDNFKYVNDTLGHLSGDQLLVEIATLLKSRLRSSDMLARLGGDEFSILLYNVNTQEAYDIAEGFRSTMSDYAFKGGGMVVDVGCSIGLSAITPDTRTMDSLFAEADFACHVAKKEGRNRIHIYTPDDQEQLDELSSDIGWTRRIKLALEQNRFVLTLMPIQSLTNNNEEKYEVLLRLLNEHDEIIMPSGFIPSAERFGLIADIDRWVVQRTMRFLQEEYSENHNVNFAINISAQSFENDELLHFIKDKIKEIGIHASQLTFEVTETMAMNDLSLTAHFLGELQKIGCKTSLDDFGTGHSSYAYLKELPADFVKIDGSFIRDAHKDVLNMTIIKSMSDIAHAMGKQTVAEFVADELIYESVKKTGIDYVQGNYVGQAFFPESERARFKLHNLK